MIIWENVVETGIIEGLRIPEIRGTFIMEVPIGRIVAFWLISGSILGPLILGNGHVTIMIVMKDRH